jgi:hypothetical protein
MSSSPSNHNHQIGQTTMGNLGYLTTERLKTKEIEAATKEYSTWCCLASMSTPVGHIEDPDEATLVKQHANQLGFVYHRSHTQVGHRWRSVNHQREWEHGGAAHD